MSKRRRANAEGTLYRRKDGRWVAALSYWEGGRQRRRAFYAKTQEEARKRLTAESKAHDDGLPVVGQRLTVGKYLGDWLEAVRPSLRPESYRRYEEACRLHIVPELGAVPLAKLTPAKVQGLYSHLLGKGLSGTSVQLTHGVLHRALRQATRWNLTVRNVADLVTAPRRSTGEMRALSPEEARRLLDAAQGHRLEGFFTLAVTCGLRLGELQGLRWSDVDLDAARLRVQRTYGGMVDGAPVFA